MANGRSDGKALAQHSREIKPGMLNGSSALAVVARASLGVLPYFPKKPWLNIWLLAHDTARRSLALQLEKAEPIIG